MSPATFGDLFTRLEEDNVRYVVVGGVAVVLRGYVRPVADLDIVIDDSVVTRGWRVRAVNHVKTPLNQLLTVLGWQVGAEWRLDGRRIVFSIPATSAAQIQAVMQPCPFAVDGMDLNTFCERLSQATTVRFALDFQYVHQSYASTDDEAAPHVFPPLPPMPYFATPPAGLTLHDLLMTVPGAYWEFGGSCIMVDKDLPPAEPAKTAPTIGEHGQPAMEPVAAGNNG